MKPTVLYWIFALGLLIAAKMGKNLIKMLMQEQIKLNDKSWSQINTLWAIFFAAMGVLNLVIALNFSEYLWVKFKVFGSLGLTIAFTAVTILFMYTKNKGEISGQQ